MNKELSLLTSKSDFIPWSYASKLLKLPEQNDTVLYLPIGLKDTGDVMYVPLSKEDECQHMYLGGSANSGKSVMLLWMITALNKMYKGNIVIHIVDGSFLAPMFQYDSGYSKFKVPGIMRNVTNKDECVMALQDIKSYIWNKECDGIIDVIILDDIDFALDSFNDIEVKILMDILWGAPKNNGHVIYASQSYAKLFDEPQCQRNIFDFDIKCLTKTTARHAIKTQGSLMAYSNVRDRGDVVLRTKDDIRLLRVPFVSSMDIRSDLLIYNS